LIKLNAFGLGRLQQTGAALDKMQTVFNDSPKLASSTSGPCSVCSTQAAFSSARRQVNNGKLLAGRTHAHAYTHAHWQPSKHITGIGPEEKSQHELTLMYTQITHAHVHARRYKYIQAHKESLKYTCRCPSLSTAHVCVGSNTYIQAHTHAQSSLKYTCCCPSLSTVHVCVGSNTYIQAHIFLSTAQGRYTTIRRHVHIPVNTHSATHLSA
jgi:hypothetical protein